MIINQHEYILKLNYHFDHIWSNKGVLRVCVGWVDEQEPFMTVDEKISCLLNNFLKLSKCSLVSHFIQKRTKFDIQVEKQLFFLDINFMQPFCIASPLIFFYKCFYQMWLTRKLKYVAAQAEVWKHCADYRTFSHHSCPAPHILCIQLGFNLPDIHQIYRTMSCMTGCFHTPDHKLLIY